MTGKQLKEIFQAKGDTAKDVAKKMKVSDVTVCNWYAKDVLKKSLESKLVKAFGLTPESSTVYIHSGHEEKYLPQLHQGHNIKKVLDEKGIKKIAFAKQMQMTRPTLDKKISEKDWNTSELIHAANILDVPVSKLKGFTNQKDKAELELDASIKMILEGQNKMYAMFQKIADKILFANKR